MKLVVRYFVVIFAFAFFLRLYPYFVAEVFIFSGLMEHIDIELAVYSCIIISMVLSVYTLNLIGKLTRNFFYKLTRESSSEF
jgi:hypothetical protein